MMVHEKHRPRLRRELAERRAKLLESPAPQPISLPGLQDMILESFAELGGEHYLKHSGMQVSISGPPSLLVALEGIAAGFVQLNSLGVVPPVFPRSSAAKIGAFFLKARHYKLVPA